ncbi:MAG: ABC transporter substrate-binding protein, partial [Chloroflexota bacterium]
TERAFAAEAWPADAPACDPASGALLGRIEAISARVVRFTLCRPDAGFPELLADPSLGILDAVSIDAIAADPAAARLVAGAGAYRVTAWIPGTEVHLERTAATASPAAAVPTVIFRWDASSASRTEALRDGSVDGIDAPAAADAATIETMPELALTSRPGLVTAYLGFGGGAQFGPVEVRRAFAKGIDRDALVRAAFPAGSIAATHLAPCVVPAGCAGADWYGFDGPAGTAALDTAGFDRKKPISLSLPDVPTPGLPDPAGTAAAIVAQLADSLGVTVTVATVPAADLAASIATGRFRGLYLQGIAAPVSDAAVFLGPLAGTGVASTAATRSEGAGAALDAAAAETVKAAREAYLAAASDAIRRAVALVPLANAGATVAFRADVKGVRASPSSADTLGSFVPGDRRQLVFMQAGEPSAAWCGLTADPDTLRLCGLVTPGLYGLARGSSEAVPALALRCVPDDSATSWSCRLRADARFTDGAMVDAGDVLATFRALGDRASPLRRALPADSFAAWDRLFGGPVATAAP